MANNGKAKLSDLTPDDRNANKGTQRGTGVIEDSLRKYGAGRSILIDRNGRIISGNKTAEAAASIGLENVRIIETDGHEIVAVKRTDLDLDSKEARELAIADNRAGELNLDWDYDEIAALLEEGVSLDGLFSDQELAVGNWHGEEADPNNLWAGMPECDSEDLTAYKSLHMHFKTKADVEAFSRLIGQAITEKTRSLWFPQAEIDRYADKRYTDES